MDYDFKWGVLWEYRNLLWIGFKFTMQISIFSLIFSLVFGTLIGVGRIARNRTVRVFCSAITEFLRNIPLIVLLFFLYFAVGFDAITAGIVGLSAYTAAFIAEIVRAGLQSVPRGNYEAAKATGLSASQAIVHVIVPHVYMITIPPLSNEFLNLIKNSSVCMTIAITELTFQTQEIDAITYRGFEAATGITLIYILINLTVAGAMNLIEKKISIKKRVG